MKNLSPAISSTVLAAGPDAIRIAIGERVEDPHPLADGLTLADIAFAAGSKVRLPNPDEPRAAVLGRGMVTSDFGRTLAHGFSGRVMAAYAGQTEDVRAICAPVEVADLRPLDLPAYDADLGLDPVHELMSDEPAVTHLAFTTAGNVQAKLTTYSKTVLISREAIINDSVGALSEIFGSIGASAGRIESRLVASLLENPPLMSDGNPVFGTAYGNLLNDSLISPGLQYGIQYLRTQMTSAGLKSDLRAKFLVVDPFNEYLARSMIKESGMDITVIVLADISPGHWYLLADPAICPVIGQLRLRGSNSPLRVEQRLAKNGQDGSLVRVSADFGHAILRRIGVVKGVGTYATP